MATAAQIAAKWSQGVTNGVESYRQGVQGVTEAPTEAAIRALPRYVQGVQDAVADGRVEAGLRRVSLEDWRKAALEKGAARLATGARAAESDFANFMSEFMPYVENVRRNLPARGTLQDNLQRMIQNATELSNFKRSR